jgi:hypothetical protein
MTVSEKTNKNKQKVKSVKRETTDCVI